MLGAAQSVFQKNWLYLVALLLVTTAIELMLGSRAFLTDAFKFIPATAIAAYGTQRHLLSGIASGKSAGAEVVSFLVYLFKSLLLVFLLISVPVAIGTMLTSGHVLDFAGRAGSKTLTEALETAPAILGYAFFGTWLPASINGVDTGFFSAGRRGLDSFLLVVLRLFAVFLIAIIFSMLAKLVIAEATSARVAAAALIIERNVVQIWQMLMASVVFALAYRRSLGDRRRAELFEETGGVSPANHL